MKGEVIVVGWVNRGKVAQDGESMKNQMMINRLEELGVRCHVMDFYRWKLHPWVILKLGWNMFVHRNYTLILSTSVMNVYTLMKLMKAIGWHQNTVHWVIGGSLSRNIKNGVCKADVIGYDKWTIVESSGMKKELEEEGVNRVIHLPNFKPITYYPNIRQRLDTLGHRPLRFVFLSRIMAEKGCDYIMEATKQLNGKSFGDKYIVDFYGKIDDSYKEVFTKKMEQTPNVNYKGFLNLYEKSGYDKLAEYDLMLFPTYWKGECFAGIFIDAFISGLPLLASNWSRNREFLQDGETALFVPVHDVVALRDRMQECIEGKHDLRSMAKACQKQAEMYNVNNVVTIDLLKQVGIIKEDK